MLGADRAGEPGPFGTYTPDPGTGGHAALSPDQGGTPGELTTRVLRFAAPRTWRRVRGA